MNPDDEEIDELFENAKSKVNEEFAEPDENEIEASDFTGEEDETEGGPAEELNLKMKLQKNLKQTVMILLNMKKMMKKLLLHIINMVV